MRGSVARGAAIIAAIAATAAIYLLVVRDDEGGGKRDRAGGNDDVPERVRELVGGLSAEQKVDGILLVGFGGTDATSPIADELRARRLGGVLVGAANWVDAFQGESLVAELKAAGREGGNPRPLIAAHQEGGSYRTLADLPPDERELDIGDLGDPERAERWSKEAGDALRRAGFDLNLAPVADVATLDSPIADRAFSDDELAAAEMTAAAVRGCERARIACAVSHFPGLGGASQSTDEGPATVSLDLATLKGRDLAPFEAAIAEGVPAVVLSHAFYAAYDPVTPGSLSRPVASHLLRDELGFRGVAITDDLGTGAIRATSGVRAAAVAAVNAGADMLLVESPGDVADVRSGLLEALESGGIDERRLDQAVGRVLELKRTLGLVDEGG